MKLTSILWRSLIHYRRSNFGVVLGVMIGTAVLTGALLVGDCVNATLKHNALTRLGDVHHALYHPTRFITEDLAKKIDNDYQPNLAPGLFLQGMVSLPSSEKRANQVSVYGVDQHFWQFSVDETVPEELSTIQEDTIIFNQKLADHLGVGEGDTIILRMQKPSAISRDAPLSTDDDSILSLRLTVASIVDDDHMGRFDLRIHQVPPMNAYLPLRFLQKQVEQPGKINMILAGSTPMLEEQGNELKKLMRDHWTMEDAQLELIPISETPVAEIRTDRIFLDPYLETVLTEFPIMRRSSSININTNINTSSFYDNKFLTYLVNSIQSNSNTTPYSMVTAVGSQSWMSAGTLSSMNSYPFSNVKQLTDGEIIINQWLADDLQASEGDNITINYYMMGAMRQLEEHARAFTVKQIIPMDHPLCDPTLMPDFPGISDSENCRDWDPGFQIKLDAIREKDEDYWDEFKGTPKAFVNLNVGQEMWSNRYGNLTSIRIPSLRNPSTIDLATIKQNIQTRLHPEQVAMVFQPIRQQALDGVKQAINFAPLFGGFSFFLITAALILVGLLFVFGIEQRAEETGTLLALGFTPKKVQNLYLSEGIILSLVGSITGIFVGMIYTKFMLWGLETVWSGAVSNTHFIFSVNIMTLIYGLLGGIVMSIFAIWLTLRKQVRARIQELLSGSISITSAFKPSKRGIWIGIISLAGTVLLVFLLPTDTAEAQAGKFFGTGAFLLIAVISFVHAWLHHIQSTSNTNALSFNSLGWKNNTRRTGRSMAVISLLACGSFLVIAVGANRKDASMNAHLPSSGTGGFTYWGELTLPLLHNLNTESGLNEFGLTIDDVPETVFTPVRIRQGDDASCLNLSRAQNPRLFAVNPADFAERNAFTFVGMMDENIPGWDMLNTPLGDNKIPAVIDQQTMLWALGKSIGDSLIYTDENGQELEIVLVGSIAGSVFQGGIIINENHFVARYPSSSGYSLVLIDTPEAQREDVSNTLSFALQDYGLNLVPAAERLAAFNAVENTYLSIFQLLGGLGLILGSAGIGVVMLRNVLERRSELALMRAVGFPTATLRKMILLEHGILLVIGLLCGVVAGAAAVVPAILTNNQEAPILSLLITLLIMFVSGWLWIWLASHRVLRGNVLNALRNE